MRSLKSRSRRSEVVPDVTTTLWPARSGKSRMPESRLVISRVPMMKIETENADLALALGVVAGRAALEIDRAVLDQRDPVLRRHRHEADGQRRQLELGLDRVEHLEHQVVRIADHLLLVVVVRERHRRLAVAEADRAGLGDPLERVRDLGAGRRGRAATSQQPRAGPRRQERADGAWVRSSSAAARRRHRRRLRATGRAGASR